MRWLRHHRGALLLWSHVQRSAGLHRQCLRVRTELRGHVRTSAGWMREHVQQRVPAQFQLRDGYMRTVRWAEPALLHNCRAVRLVPDLQRRRMHAASMHGYLQGEREQRLLRQPGHQRYAHALHRGSAGERTYLELARLQADRHVRPRLLLRSP